MPTQHGSLARDDNEYPIMGGTSNVDNKTIINSSFDPITRRLLTTGSGGSGSITVTDGVTTVSNVTTLDFTSGATVTAGATGTADVAITSGGTGTVTTVSVVTANGFAGTVANATSTPAITLTTSVTGLLKGNGTVISAATLGTDYSGGTSALTTGILKSTTTTGALTIAVAADFPTLNQSTTGSAATLTTPRAINGVNFDGSAAITVTAAAGTLTGTTLNSTVVTSSLTTLGSSASLPGSPTTTTQSPSDNSTKVATTAYVDAAVLGQNFKEAALVATTANLVGVYLSGVFTYTATGTDNIDGVNLALGNRVLVKNQTTTFQNGIYSVTTAGAIGVAGVLTRSSDANTSAEFKTGDALFVTSGTVNASTTWAYTGVDSPTLGTDAITYAQIAGLGSYVAGNGLTLTGNSFAIDTSITIDKTTAQTLTNKTLTSPTLTTPVINGIPTGTGVASTATASTLVLRDTNANESSNAFIPGFTTTATAAGTTTLTIASTQTQLFTGSTTQTVKLPTTSVVAGTQYYILNGSTGAVTIQSSGANTIVILASNTGGLFTALSATPTTAAGWSFNYYGLSVASSKAPAINNSIGFSGTDGTVMTFPGSSATLARIDAANTFVGTQSFTTISTTNITSTSNIVSNNAITASTNAATVPITATISTVTNNSAATLTITLTTGAANRQLSEVLILDSSVAAQTITWVNTENSTVSVPTTSNGSTTLPLSVLFQYNSATSKWRCIATA